MSRFLKSGLLRNLVLVVFVIVGNRHTVNAQDCNTDKTNGITSGSILASAATLPGINAFDNERSTFWYTTVPTPNIRIDLGTPTVITNYSLTSGPLQGILNDTYDARNFTLAGSNDGSTYTTLDTRTGETFASRLLTKYYSFTNVTAYRYYRLTITANNGATGFYCSEIQLLPTSDCIVGNVTNSITSAGISAVPVTIRTVAGAFATTTTDASGHFSFSTASAPGVDYGLIITPPAGTYVYSDPVVNWNTSVMSAPVLTLTQQGYWPTGAFLNVFGNGLSVAGTPFMIDNTEGAKVPASFDWTLRTSPIAGPLCPAIPTSLDGNGTFGTMSVADYESNHPWQPGFHSGAIPVGGEAHPNLHKSLTSAISGYVYGGVLFNNRGALYDEGKYNVTNFIGTLQDVGFFYGRTGLTNINSSFNLLNGFNGGWRKTYGRTTGDAYDLFLAANGQTSTSSILEFTASIATPGTKYLNFYGKNANAFMQGIYTNVEILFSVYDGSNTLVSSSTLILSPVTSSAQDNPSSPWEGRTFTFTASTPGTYTFKVTIPTTSQLGNDFYLDEIILSECPIQYNLTGTVWNDGNGNAIKDGSEAGTDAGSSLYVNLVDDFGFVVTTVKVNADGTYSMPIPQNVTGYKLVLTNNQGSVTPSLPSAWVNTGDNAFADNTAAQGSTLGVIELNTLTSDIAGQDFGIEQPPVATSVSQLVPYPSSGSISAGTVSQNVAGTDLEETTMGNDDKIIITNLPANATVLYNGVPLTLNQEITGFNPALLSYSGITLGSSSIVFNYAFIDQAGKQGTAASYTVSWSPTLPVVIEDFAATVTTCNNVTATWKISNAIDFSHFELERSGADGQFKTVGVIVFNESISNYQHVDKLTNSGNYSYRLKLVDADGTARYSKTILVRNTCAANQRKMLYPNPVYDKALVTGLNDGDILTLYNSFGQVMQSFKTTGNQHSLNLLSETAGVYYLVITDKNGTRVFETKVVKIK